MSKKGFDYITFPKIAPEKGVTDYLRSKLEQKTFKKYPAWDTARADPAVTLVAARRDYHEAEVRLIEKKEQNLKRGKEFHLQWEKLEKEALKLRETFCDFDKMVKENADKRDRATNKIKKEKFLQNKWDQAINELQLDYDKLYKVKNEMENQIKNHSIYEDYLNKVAESTDEFKNAKDVFNQFGALEEARDTLSQKLDDNIKILENIKDKILEKLKQQSVVLMGLDNQITVLEERYNVSRRNSEKWEEVVQKIQSTSGEKLTEILAVRKCCLGIYLDVCKRKNIEPQLNKNDFEGQLWCIKNYMLRLKEILKIAQQKSETDISSVYVERPTSKRRL